MKIVFKPLIFLIITFAFLANCEKDEPSFACGVEYPEENLLWLKEALNYYVFADIFKYVFDGIEYIIISDPEGASSIMERVYTCDGTKVCIHGGWPGGGDCSIPTNFWDEYYENRLLIFQLRSDLDK